MTMAYVSSTPLDGATVEADQYANWEGQLIAQLDDIPPEYPYAATLWWNGEPLSAVGTFPDLDQFGITFESGPGHSTWQIKWQAWGEYPAGQTPVNDLYIVLQGSQPPSKPTTPTPANGSGPGIDFSNFTFSWQDGGGATSYRVRIGSQPEAVNLFATVETESFTAAVGSAARAFILSVQDTIYWRIDAVDGEEVTIGDVWSFDPRPAKAENPSPADDAASQRLNVATLSWDAVNYADGYDVYFDTGSLVDLVSAGQSGTSLSNFGQPLRHSTEYVWRVDSSNQFGTTEGDVWSFTTLTYDPPLTSWANLPGKTLGPLGVGGAEPGVEGVDFYYTGENFGTKVRRLTAAAKDSLWYESLGE